MGGGSKLLLCHSSKLQINKSVKEKQNERKAEAEETTKTVKEINEATAETLFDSFSVLRFQLNEMENFNCCVCVVLRVCV